MTCTGIDDICSGIDDICTGIDDNILDTYMEGNNTGV